MSLQERTLVIKNFDPEKTTKNLLTELFIQGGPVRNVVIRPDHAFVEYEDIESVGYSKALLDGVEMFGKKLDLQPKARSASQMKYVKLLNDYILFDRRCKEQQSLQQQQMAFYQQQPPPPLQQQFQPPMPTPPPVYQPQPIITRPPYPVQLAPSGPNPQIFNLNPFVQQAQAQFLPPDPWASSSSSSVRAGPATNPVRRSFSFNDKSPGYSGNFNRNDQFRNSDRRRR